MNLLSGVRVLDLTRLYPGPFCTMLLGDMGAEIIKIESPGEGDYIRRMGPMYDQDSYYFHLLNRNKKSVTLNLKSPEGLEIFNRLAMKADVIVEGFRPGVVDSLKIGYTDIKNLNQDIIYCSISGYGQDGPYRNRAGHDINYIGLAGILGLTGLNDGQPIIPSVQIGDVGGGSLMALSAILASLYARSQGRSGQYLDVAMLDGLVSWMPFAAAEYFAGNTIERGSSILNGGYAFYNVYQAKDGGYMSLGALETKFWQEFCEAIDRDDLRARQYEANQESLKIEIQNIFLQRTRKEWEDIFINYDCCCEPVLALKEAFTHPQVQARKAVDDNTLSFPIKTKGSGSSPSLPAPRLGEHTSDVLADAGYSSDDVLRFKAKGIV